MLYWYQSHKCWQIWLFSVSDIDKTFFYQYDFLGDIFLFSRLSDYVYYIHSCIYIVVNKIVTRVKSEILWMEIAALKLAW